MANFARSSLWIEVDENNLMYRYRYENKCYKEGHNGTFLEWLNLFKSKMCVKVYKFKVRLVNNSSLAVQQEL